MLMGYGIRQEAFCKEESEEVSGDVYKYTGQTMAMGATRNRET
jgi:hypothetical protein